MKSITEIREEAFYYRDLYRSGVISKELAKEKIQPYIDLVNKKSLEVSKKYNQRQKILNFINFVR